MLEGMQKFDCMSQKFHNSGMVIIIFKYIHIQKFLDFEFQAQLPAVASEHHYLVV